MQPCPKSTLPKFHSRPTRFCLLSCTRKHFPHVLWPTESSWMHCRVPCHPSTHFGPAFHSWRVACTTIHTHYKTLSHSTQSGDPTVMLFQSLCVERTIACDSTHLARSGGCPHAACCGDPTQTYAETPKSYFGKLQPCATACVLVAYVPFFRLRCNSYKTCCLIAWLMPWTFHLHILYIRSHLDLFTLRHDSSWVSPSP